MKQCARCNHSNSEDRAICEKCGEVLVGGEIRIFSSFDDPESETRRRDPNACSHCYVVAAEPGHDMKLCRKCRDFLSRQPLPAWVWLSAFVVLVAMLVSFMNFPNNVGGAIAYARGEKAEAAGDYQTAVTEYTRVTEAFQGSSLPYARLGLAMYHAGYPEDAASMFRSHFGQDLPNKVRDEINEAMLEIMHTQQAQPANPGPVANPYAGPNSGYPQAGDTQNPPEEKIPTPMTTRRGGDAGVEE